jgi:putative NIF3 family GTP cyclohydrolase 1 type 2
MINLSPNYSIHALISLYLIITGNFMVQLFSCDLLSVIIDNIFLRHMIGFLTLLFFVRLTGPGKSSFQNIITDCKESQISVYVAHTNADNATEGVSDALASALGLEINSSITNRELKTGMGRVGRLVTPTSLTKFAELVGKALPINNFGTLVAGDLKKEVSNVACCAGSGASLLAELANHQVDVFVTADLKHHAAIDHLQDSEIALVNVSHWASEWLWLNVLQRKLNREFPAMKVHVSNLVTDAWDLHISTGATQ